MNCAGAFPSTASLPRRATREYSRSLFPQAEGRHSASLRFALHHAQRNKMDRIVYVIPFTTIIDQNAEEVRKILEPPD